MVPFVLYLFPMYNMIHHKLQENTCQCHDSTDISLGDVPGKKIVMVLYGTIPRTSPRVLLMYDMIYNK